MEMPKKIDASLFAPCGMNCLVCYKHCCHKKPCAGCGAPDEGKPGHCRKCRIKNCCGERGFAYCFECPSHPCKLIKNLERSYNARYSASLLDNSALVQAKGLAAFMEAQRTAHTCPVCGGVISIHDGECSQCRQKTDHGPFGFRP